MANYSSSEAQPAELRYLPTTERATWVDCSKELKSLILGGSEGYYVLRFPRFEKLRWRVSGTMPRPVGHHLSRLRLLHIPHDVFATIASTASMPDLEHFHCFEAESSHLPRFQALTLHAPNITSIWFKLHRDPTLPGFKSFLARFPRLTKLYINNGPHDVLVQGSDRLALRRDAAGACVVIADIEAEAQRLQLDYMSWEGGSNWLSWSQVHFLFVVSHE
ncbi:hypothetical protein C8R47DRAFT_1206085 [Mycena vitilis]|nr:hypothetical protein C8R47DRAFT_1206085 [Mycena vitilis]